MRSSIRFHVAAEGSGTAAGLSTPAGMFPIRCGDRVGAPRPVYSASPRVSGAPWGHRCRRGRPRSRTRGTLHRQARATETPMIRFALFGAGRAGRIHAREHRPPSRGRTGRRLRCRPGGGRVAGRRARGADTAGSGPTSGPRTRSTRCSSRPRPTRTSICCARRFVPASRPTARNRSISTSPGHERSSRKRPGPTCPLRSGSGAAACPSTRKSAGGSATGRSAPVETLHLVSRDYHPPSRAYVDVSGGFLRDKTIHYFDLVPWVVGRAPDRGPCRGLVSRRSGVRRGG